MLCASNAGIIFENINIGKQMFCCLYEASPEGQRGSLTSTIWPAPIAAVGENSPTFVMANPHATPRKLIRIGVNESVNPGSSWLTHSRMRGCTETHTSIPVEMVSMAAIRALGKDWNITVGASTEKWFWLPGYMDVGPFASGHFYDWTGFRQRSCIWQLGQSRPLRGLVGRTEIAMSHAVKVQLGMTGPVWVTWYITLTTNVSPLGRSAVAMWVMSFFPTPEWVGSIRDAGRVSSFCRQTSISLTKL